MKPLKFRGIPEAESYEAMTINEKVSVGVLFEKMLAKTYHQEVAKHLSHLKEISLSEGQYYLMNSVDNLGNKLELDYRGNILRFDKFFAQKHPQRKFFTHALIDCESFSEVVAIKNIVVPLVRDLAKNPKEYLETKIAG